MRASISQTPGTLRPLLRLVWPVLIEQLLVMLIGFSDMLLVGHYLRPEHQAAMTVISYALWMLTNLFAIVAIGALAMTARFVGAGDWPAANRVTNQSFVLGALLAVVFTVTGLLLGDRLAGILQLEGEPAILATRFLRVLVMVLPMMMLEAVSIGCLRGAGDMVTGLVSMIVVNVVNVAVAWSLLLGVGPLPEMGWDALPIGTACGHTMGGLIPFTVLVWGRSGLRIRRTLLCQTSNSCGAFCGSACRAESTCSRSSSASWCSCRSSTAWARWLPRPTAWPFASSRWPTCQATPSRSPPPRCADSISAPATIARPAAAC